MKINNSLIIKDDNPLIREKSKDVVLPLSDEDKEILLSMYEYVKNSTIQEIAEEEDLKPAVGISAIQIGIKKKLVVVVIRDNEGEIIHQYALANPKTISNSIEKSYLKNGEGCLSVDGEHQGLIYRSARIKVKGYDLLTDENITIKADGYLSIVLQHELDHLKGILFYDHIDNIEPFKIDEDAIEIE